MNLLNRVQGLNNLLLEKKSPEKLKYLYKGKKVTSTIFTAQGQWMAKNKVLAQDGSIEKAWDTVAGDKESLKKYIKTDLDAVLAGKEPMGGKKKKARTTSAPAISAPTQGSTGDAGKHLEAVNDDQYYQDGYLTQFSTESSKRIHTAVNVLANKLIRSGLEMEKIYIMNHRLYINTSPRPTRNMYVDIPAFTLAGDQTLMDMLIEGLRDRRYGKWVPTSGDGRSYRNEYA